MHDLESTRRRSGSGVPIRRFRAFDVMSQDSGIGSQATKGRTIRKWSRAMLVIGARYKLHAARYTRSQVTFYWARIGRFMTPICARLSDLAHLALRPIQAKALIQQYRWYWRVRQTWSKVGFRSLSLYVQGRGRFWSTITSGRLLRDFARMSLGYIVAAILLVIACFKSEATLRARTTSWGNWFADYYEKADVSLFSSFYSTLASIAGVFLGLYFTAVTVVASARYADSPSILRTLVLKEKAGNLYVKIVVILGMISLLSAFLCTLQVDPGVVNLMLTVLIGCISIPCFVVLGWRAFQFFDPDALTSQIEHELANSIKCVTSRTTAAMDKSIQYHFQRGAEFYIRAYEQMTTQAIHRPDSESLQRILSSSLVVLCRYIRNKARIPSDSYWFKRKHEHPNWLRSPNTQLQLAIETSTVLEPTEIPSLDWFETDLYMFFDSGLRHLLSKGELRQSAEILDMVRNALREMSRHYGIQEATTLARRQMTLVDTYLPSRDQVMEPNSRLRLGQLDVSATFPMSCLLGLVDAIKENDVKSMMSQVERAKWHRLSSVLQKSVPREVTQCLEWLAKSIQFERVAENSVITPTWYSQQHVGIAYAKGLAASIDHVVTTAEECYRERAQNYAKNGDVECAIEITASGLEFCSKYRAHWKVLEDALTDALRGNWQQYHCATSIDLGLFQTRVARLEERLFVIWADALPILNPLERPPDLPDYFGQGTLLLAKRCAKLLREESTESFKRLLTPLIKAALKAYNTTLQEEENTDAATRVTLASEALVDIAEISGLAIAFGELFGNEFGKIVNEAWNEALSSTGDRDGATKQLMLILALRDDDDIRASPHAVLRTGWRQELAHELRSRGLMSSRLTPMAFPPAVRVEHSSNLIRVLSSHDIMIHQMKDVFAVCYLAQRVDAENLALTTSARRMKDELESEVRRSNCEAFDDDDR